MKTYIGVDLGGTNVRVAKVDETGAILQIVKEPTEIGKGVEQVVSKIISMIERIEGYEAVAGVIGMITLFVILSYYSIVGGWIMKYIAVYFGGAHFSAEYKTDFQDLVTEYDRSMEEQIRNALNVKFPTHSFLGEESVRERGDHLWILDPIDGTTNFVSRGC